MKDVIIREQSNYMDIFQKRPTRYRVYETLVYMAVMFVLAGYMPVDGGLYKGMAVVSAILIIGGAPVLYRKVLAPEYILTKTDLMIRLGGEERLFSLLDVERSSEWKALFKLKGKKESLMVSRDFLHILDNQLQKLRKSKKR